MKYCIEKNAEKFLKQRTERIFYTAKLIFNVNIKSNKRNENFVSAMTEYNYFLILYKRDEILYWKKYGETSEATYGKNTLHHYRNKLIFNIDAI